MANRRMLTAEFTNSYEFAKLTDDAALAFLLTLPYWDRDGLLDADPSRTLGQILTARTDLRDRINLCVNQWIAADIVESYEIGAGRRVLFWKTFRVHNTNLVIKREAPSRYPCPPGWERSSIGLVPTDEGKLINLIYNLDPRSDYRKALEVVAHNRGYRIDSQTTDDEIMINHDEIMISSRSDRAEDQRKDQRQMESDGVDGVDQSIRSSSSILGNKGGPGGGGTLASYTRAQLCMIAANTGSLLGLQEEWTGFSDYLLDADTDTLILLIEWIAYYSNRDNEAVASLTAIIRSHIKRGQRAALRTPERQQMISDAARCIELQGEAV